MFAISPTDKKWFDFLKVNQINSNVNFWTPTPWNIKKLKSGDKLYFMIKAPIRKIGGFGEFIEYKNLTAEEAWNVFGFGNGRQHKEDFLLSIQDYINRNSEKFGGETLNPSTYNIGCIILKNCEFWDESNFKDLIDYDMTFSNSVVKIKYYNSYDFILSDINNTSNQFQIISEPRENKRINIQSRSGQGVFKGLILKAYDNKCCVTGETTPELLEAAHIQEYRNQDSNHAQNGLLLRVDIHRLYDNNLIFIDKNCVVHISNSITNDYYKQLNGLKISLPESKYDYPSIECLELKRNDFRN